MAASFTALPWTEAKPRLDRADDPARGSGAEDADDFVSEERELAIRLRVKFSRYAAKWDAGAGFR